MRYYDDKNEHTPETVCLWLRSIQWLTGWLVAPSSTPPAARMNNGKVKRATQTTLGETFSVLTAAADNKRIGSWIRGVQIQRGALNKLSTQVNGTSGCRAFLYKVESSY